MLCMHIMIAMLPPVAASVHRLQCNQWPEQCLASGSAVHEECENLIMQTTMARQGVIFVDHDSCIAYRKLATGLFKKK